MGNSEIRNKIWTAITSNDAETVRNILKKYPEFLDSPISDDKKTNAITRAAYLDRPHIIAELISLGVNLNKPAESKISALMWAAAKGNIESAKLLLNFGADISQKGPYDMIAIDFAVLFGSYNTAFYLYSIGSNPSKTIDQYLEIKNHMKSPWIDFGGFLMSLDKEIPPDIVPFFTLAPQIKEKVFEDPVRDPNETWGNWVNRILEFERPPLIERASIQAKKSVGVEEKKSEENIHQEVTVNNFEGYIDGGFEDIHLN
ncbi:hypothetical protein SteCoe_39336 [Stentor coeruleus]|uniref:Uncharacterized protein n=1 Tax=Stentor coeruleus TaxID=5963 RepID=A0A1R2AKR7_9CILI|nr:hypothetical protein SteCoe_39336 [Stentor coeruleus]